MSGIWCIPHPSPPTPRGLIIRFHYPWEASAHGSIDRVTSTRTWWFRLVFVNHSSSLECFITYHSHPISFLLGALTFLDLAHYNTSKDCVSEMDPAYERQSDRGKKHHKFQLNRRKSPPEKDVKQYFNEWIQATAPLPPPHPDDWNNGSWSVQLWKQKEKKQHNRPHPWRTRPQPTHHWLKQWNRTKHNQ